MIALSDHYHPLVNTYDSCQSIGSRSLKALICHLHHSATTKGCHPFLTTELILETCQNTGCCCFAGHPPDRRRPSISVRPLECSWALWQNVPASSGPTSVAMNGKNYVSTGRKVPNGWQKQVNFMSSCWSKFT